MYSEQIKKLINIFTGFPGVGPKTAARFVFYLAGKDDSEIEELTKSIKEVNRLSRCRFCFRLFSPKKNQKELCEICSDPRRKRDEICVVEKETDQATIEKTNSYKGLYFILGGSVSSLKKEEIERLRTDPLKARLKNPQKFGIDTKFKEVILALSPTLEGDSTIIYLKRKLKPLGIKVSVLGRGLPTGGELEYADNKTLSSAFSTRKEV